MNLPNRPMPNNNDVALQREIADGDTVDFEAGSEPWVTIKLADGAELKYRSTISSITRISDDPLNGKARYFVQHQDVVRVVKQPQPMNGIEAKSVGAVRFNAGTGEIE